jgi:hypothetical protein
VAKPGAAEYPQVECYSSSVLKFSPPWHMHGRFYRSSIPLLIKDIYNSAARADLPSLKLDRRPAAYFVLFCFVSCRAN